MQHDDLYNAEGKEKRELIQTNNKTRLTSGKTSGLISGLQGDKQEMESGVMKEERSSWQRKWRGKDVSGLFYESSTGKTTWILYPMIS